MRLKREEASVEKFTQVLESMHGRLDVHAKLINTFSLLEYIGSRKIVKSQTDRELNAEVLSHIAEEIRHSLVLKNLALKLSSGELISYSDDHLLCGSAGKLYIQTVDKEAQRLLPESVSNPWVNYLLTTLLVEERASQIYPIYDAWLENLGQAGKFKSIIRDEDRHLQVVSDHLEANQVSQNSYMNELRTIESHAFNRFMDSILMTLQTTL